MDDSRRLERGYFLLVDDNPSDALLIRRAFARARVPNAILHVPSVEHAIAYLQTVGAEASDETPLIGILLDLAMPGMTGFQFLQWRACQPAMGRVPVIVLTSSYDTETIDRTYAQGALAFLRKPGSAEQIAYILKRVRDHFGGAKTRGYAASGEASGKESGDE